jgi:hypothetical protein
LTTWMLDHDRQWLKQDVVTDPLVFNIVDEWLRLYFPSVALVCCNVDHYESAAEPICFSKDCRTSPMM